MRKIRHCKIYEHREDADTKRHRGRDKWLARHFFVVVLFALHVCMRADVSQTSSDRAFNVL